MDMIGENQFPPKEGTSYSLSTYIQDNLIMNIHVIENKQRI